MLTRAPSRPMVAVSLITLLLTSLSCQEAPPLDSTARNQPRRINAASETDASPQLSKSSGQLRDIAAEIGIRCVQHSGASGSYAYPEIVFGGVCVADFNGDRRLDVCFPQGGEIGGATGEVAPANVIFMQNADAHFHPHALNGTAVKSYTMGAFAGDVDADGDLDLLLTNAGTVRLLQNDGAANFTDVTVDCGIPQRIGVWLNAVIMDLNHDRAIDIYVANYVNWTPETDIRCDSTSGQRDYCHPTNYDGQPDLLLHGRGDGSFVDVTDSCGIGGAATRSMGVVVFDVDNDGRLDIFVANDGEANLLWMNQGDGTYRDEAVLRGVALNAAGKAEASMGVAAADVDADGDEDLILSHLKLETHTVYRNEGGYFTDATVASGIGGWSRPDTGFGIGLIDVDNDRHLDLFVANGAVVRPTRPLNPDEVYAQPDRLAMGVGGARFPDAIVVEGDDLESGPVVSRGAAFGDLDGDGTVEIMVSVKDAPARVLKFASPVARDHDWIGIRPIPSAGASSEVGAQAKVLDIDADFRTLRPHSSYLGSSEHVIRFGLGQRRGNVGVVVRWLDGTLERFEQLETRRVHALERGTGAAVASLVASSHAAEATPSTTAEPVDQTAPAAAGALVSVPKISPITAAIPPIRFEQESKLRTRVVLDINALREWCASAGLPAPPNLTALNPPTWKLVHDALAAIAADPTSRNLGALAMYYDAHQVRDAAIHLYRQALAVDPTEPRWWHLLGRALSRDGRLAEAVAAFEKAATLAPENDSTQARLAEMYFETNQTARAIERWERYLQIRPEETAAMTGLAIALEANGELERAFEVAERAIDSSSSARAAMLVASRIAARLDDRQQAEAYQRQAADVAVGSPSGITDVYDQQMAAFAKTIEYLKRASEHFKSVGDYERSLSLAKELADRRPQYARNWQLLVWLSMNLGDESAVVEYSQIAVELDPQFAPGWEVIARARLEEGDADSALEYADRALAVDRDFAFGHSTRGRALAALNRHVEALQALDAAIEANPEDLAAWKARVTCLSELGRTEEVLQALSTMQSQFPEDPWPRETRAGLSDDSQ